MAPASRAGWKLPVPGCEQGLTMPCVEAWVPPHFRNLGIPDLGRVSRGLPGKGLGAFSSDRGITAPSPRRKRQHGEDAVSAPKRALYGDAAARCWNRCCFSRGGAGARRWFLRTLHAAGDSGSQTVSSSHGPSSRRAAIAALTTRVPISLPFILRAPAPPRESSHHASQVPTGGCGAYDPFASVESRRIQKVPSQFPARSGSLNLEKTLQITSRRCGDRGGGKREQVGLSFQDQILRRLAPRSPRHREVPRQAVVDVISKLLSRLQKSVAESM